MDPEFQVITPVHCLILHQSITLIIFFLFLVRCGYVGNKTKREKVFLFTFKETS